MLLYTYPISIIVIVITYPISIIVIVITLILSQNIPVCTPTFFIKLKNSKYTLNLIGSCKAEFLPPVIILQLEKLMSFTSG